MGKLLFDADTHEYSVDGVVIPSVTQVLEAVGVSDYSMITKADRDYYFTRGTYVHKAMELLLKDQLDWDTVDESIIGYVRAGEKFVHDTGFTADYIEESLHHEQYRYAGTLDVAGLLGNRKVILDWKTGAVQEHVKYQIGGYCELLRRKTNKFYNIGYGVELKANGIYKMSEEYDNYRTGQEFLSFVATYHSQKIRIKDGQCEQV